MAKLHHSHAGLLVVRNKRQLMIPLTKDVTTVGRKLADIILDDPKVSSTHCEIRREGSKFILIDTQSTNGCYVNREPAVKKDLIDQDVIEVGSTTLCFFEDIRDFHGSTEESTAGMRLKDETVSQKKIGESLTTTRTISQLMVEFEILKGPNQGKVYKFKKPHITIGRNEADVVLIDPDISRQHCLVEVLGPTAVFLKDLGSTNGTLINEKRVSSEKMKSGDQFSVGNTLLCIRFDEGD